MPIVRNKKRIPIPNTLIFSTTKKTPHFEINALRCSQTPSQTTPNYVIDDGGDYFYCFYYDTDLLFMFLITTVIAKLEVVMIFPCTRVFLHRKILPLHLEKNRRGPIREKTEKPKFLPTHIYFAPYGDSGGFGVTEWSGKISCVEIDSASPIFCLTE